MSINVAMQPDEIAGVRPAANWNTAAGPMGALTALVFSDGRRAAASATWDAPMTPTSTGVLLLGYADLPGDVRMMNGVLNPAWLDVPAAAATLVTVGNLPAEIAAGGYDVYVYVLGGIPVVGERRYTYTIGATTFNVTQEGPTPTTVTAPYPYVLAPDMGSGNYIVFKQVVGSTFTLLATPSASSALRAPVNGLQIVWPAGP